MANLAAFTCLTLLLASLPLLVFSEDCVNVIYLKTGNVDHAGTDADVALKLYDAKGNSVGKSDITPYGLMGRGHDYYEIGNLDLFSFKTECLASEVCKIELSHDNTGQKPGWFISYLKVSTTSPNGGCTYKTFNIEQWLARDEYPYSLTLTRDNCAGSQLNTDTAINSVLNLPSSE